MDDHMKFFYKPRTYKKVATCKDGRVYNKKYREYYRKYVLPIIENEKVREATSVVNLLRKCQRANPVDFSREI